MFVKASWIAIVAALCVAQTHAVEAAEAPAKPENAAIGTSTLIRDANGKAIGSQANYYDKDKKFISSKTTYFTETPAAAPADAREAGEAADASAKPAYYTAKSTLIHDANGKTIGSQATYLDKDGKVVDTKTTYYSNAPAAAPAVVREAEKSADAPAKPAYHHGKSTLIRDANGKAIGSSATYYDKDGKVIDSKTTYFSNAPAAAPADAREAGKTADAPAKPAYHHAKSTSIQDANGKPIGSSATYYDKDGNVIDSKTTYYSNAPAAAPAAGRESDESADAPAKPAGIAFGTSTIMRAANGSIIGSETSYGTVMPAQGATA
jgi:hypothetical protein